jgi:hypothetical protein
MKVEEAKQAALSLLLYAFLNCDNNLMINNSPIIGNFVLMTATTDENTGVNGSDAA